MEIKRIGSKSSGKGPASELLAERDQYFTGNVQVDSLFQANYPSRMVGAVVTFEPGARSAWHAHPLGQTLIVTSGRGLIQSRGGPVEEIRQGDIIWIPPNEKHWHGAAPDTAMTHIFIVEQEKGRLADWLEKVSDEEYGAKKRAA